MWPKKNIFKIFLKKLQKNPQPKTENMQPIFKNYYYYYYYYYYLQLCKITEKVAELQFGDFNRCIKKGSKSTPTSNKYRDKYIYTQHLLTHSYWPLLTSHAKTHCGREPNNYFCCFSSLQNTRLAAALDCRNNVLKYETRSFIPCNTHVYYTHTHTHTHTVFLSPQSFISKSQHG